MSDQEERGNILKWLFDGCFGRIVATAEGWRAIPIA